MEWKADVATLVEFMGEAFRNELGLTNPLRPRDAIRGCGANLNSPEGACGVPLAFMRRARRRRTHAKRPNGDIYPRRDGSSMNGCLSR